MELGSEDEKELFVKRGGVRVQAEKRAGAEALRQGKGLKSSPEWLNKSEQGRQQHQMMRFARQVGPLSYQAS